MLWIIWAVISTVLIPFCFWIGWALGFRRGYRVGAKQVLNEWKKYMITLEDIKNDNNQGSL